MAIGSETEIVTHSLPLASDFRDVRTLGQLLAYQARVCGAQRAFTLLGDDQRETTITFAELHSRAQSIAARLSECTTPGDRALLVYPTGIDFIAAFFGCVYAGVLAVPATYPKPKRPMPRLVGMAKDCGATLALTSASSLASFDLSQSPELQQLQWIATDQIEADTSTGQLHDARPDDLCFLQYTSGSTSDPKGVMVSHANLLANLELILVGNGVQRCDGENPGRTGVFWIPHFHDMGLICGILGTVYEGGHSVLMTPTAFLQRPIRWLAAISKYRAEVSGAPNFAYELCLRKTTAAERAELDLSSWQVAFCSAEPVRAETLEQFAEAFASQGFASDALYPCYGLAEATLMAAGNPGPGGMIVKRVLRASLAENRWSDANGESEAQVQRLVGCGGELLDQELVIVDPHTLQRLNGHSIGEIWIKGPCVARGYWDRPDETARTFRARLADNGDGPYLRTGDVGFLHDGQLFVAGRIKDVMILRGRNYYPQDLEHTVEAAHPALLYGAGCAFAVPETDGDRPVVVHEVDRRCPTEQYDEIVRRIRLAVAEEHDLELAGISLLRQASLPRTTSGKAQRQLCRELYQTDQLNALHTWKSVPVAQRATPLNRFAALQLPRGDRPLAPDEVDRLAEQIERGLLDWLVQRGGVPAKEVARDRPFAEYGLDSLKAVELSQELEDWLGLQLSTVVAWKYPTAESMARYLASQVGGVAAEAQIADRPARRRTVRGYEELLAEIEALSDDEARRQLQRRSAPHP